MKNVEFLLQNLVSMLQLVDQGIFGIVKQQYRKRLVRLLFMKLKHSKNAQPSIFNFFDAVHYPRVSRNNVKPENIVNCNRKIAVQ